jgi:hypothetical protein
VRPPTKIPWPRFDPTPERVRLALADGEIDRDDYAILYVLFARAAALFRAGRDNVRLENGVPVVLFSTPLADIRASIRWEKTDDALRERLHGLAQEWFTFTVRRGAGARWNFQLYPSRRPETQNVPNSDDAGAHAERAILATQNSEQSEIAPNDTVPVPDSGEVASAREEGDSEDEDGSPFRIPKTLRENPSGKGTNRSSATVGQREGDALNHLMQSAEEAFLAEFIETFNAKIVDDEPA